MTLLLPLSLTVFVVLGVLALNSSRPEPCDQHLHSTVAGPRTILSASARAPAIGDGLHHEGREDP